VGLGSLANYECVNLATASRGLVHDCCADRVSTHGQTAGCLKVSDACLVEHVEHYLTN
jgi:hypothetical protein